MIYFKFRDNRKRVSFNFISFLSFLVIAYVFTQKVFESVDLDKNGIYLNGYKVNFSNFRGKNVSLNLKDNFTSNDIFKIVSDLKAAGCKDVYIESRDD